MQIPVFKFSDFNCERCGVCCLNEEMIRLTIVDLFRMAGHLKIQPDQFFKRYCTISDPASTGRKSLNLKTRGGCPFYQNHACSIYEVRPYVCRAFPFTYPKLEHAIYRCNGLTFDQCGITNVPYTAILEGNVDLLIEEGIAVQVTNQYLTDYRYKFDEKAAIKYLETVETLENRDSVKAATRNLIFTEAREMQNATCTPENFSGLFVFMSGFYSLYLKEVDEERRQGKDVLSVLPQVHGTSDNSLYLQLEKDDYTQVKKILSTAKDPQVKIKALLTYNDEEWSCLSTGSQSTTVMTFCRVRKNHKAQLRQKPGEISLFFTNRTGNTYQLTGKDVLDWLSGVYPEPPVEYHIPEPEES